MSETTQQPAPSSINIKLELNLEEVNTILASLGKHPFENIFQLINKIQAQGTEQLPKNNSQEATPAA